MQSFILTLRAIGTNLAMRLYLPAVLAAGAIVALVIIAGLWLTSFSSWWWLLFVPITIASCVVIGAALVVLLLIRYVRPAQTKAQKQAVKQFVDKMQGIAEFAGTPKFIILFQVVRSIAAPTKSTYLADLAKNKQLAGDFRELQRLFTDPRSRGR